jgi:hypothetical protein
MKKLLIPSVIALITFSTKVSAQECKVKTDEFTQEVTVSFEYGEKVVYFEYKKGAGTLEMLFTYGGDIKQVVPKGTEVLFKLENKEIIKLTTASDTNPKVVPGVKPEDTVTDYSYVMTVTKEDATKFTTSPVVLVRYPDEKGGQMDWAPNGKQKKTMQALMKGAECMKANMK